MRNKNKFNQEVC